MHEELWLEDLYVGQAFRTPSIRVDEAQIIEFASRYDPQPFHMDPEAAEATVFGGLVASGWHTTSLTMRLCVLHGPPIAGGLVGLAVDELRWQALRPGDEIRLEAEVIEVRRSERRPERGTIRMRLRTLDSEGREVLHAITTMLVPARGAAEG